MKKSRRYIRLLIFSGVFASAIFTGTRVFANPLTTYAQFYQSISDDIINNVSGTHHDLGADIDVSGAIGATVFSGTFKGTLNGLNSEGPNFTIFGLTKPLFDRIGDGAEIKNLQLETDSVDGVTGNGALANTLDAGGTVNNVDVTGNVTGGTEVGGLIGNSSGTITNSTVVGDVTGTGDYVGGLVGKSVGDISDSSASGAVTGQNADFYPTNYIGGLVGESEGNITDSSASGSRWGNDYVGGLVGKSVGDIRDSSATGESDYPETEGFIPEFVIGSEFVGGLVGYSEGDVINSNAAVGVGGLEGDYTGGLVGKSVGDIRDSSASGVVFSVGMGGPGDYTGGLVGYTTGDVTNSDASGDVEGGSYVGGLVGYTTGDVTNSDASGDVEGGSNVGGLVGYSKRNIEDSHATGDVISLTSFEFDSVNYGVNGYMGVRNSGEYLGGLVGYTEGDIADSYATGDVSSTVEVSFENAPNVFSIEVYSGSNLGGLVGRTDGVITDSYAEGVVSSTATLNILSIEDSVTDEVTAEILIESGGDLGGLAGYSAEGVLGSRALGDVSSTITLTIVDAISDRINVWEDYGEYNEADQIGGLVGLSDGDIANSYATGNVAGDDRLGGLVGYLMYDSTISFSYATGDVTGNSANADGLGGLVGELDERAKIRNSYATGDVTGDDKLGGLVGNVLDESEISFSYATGDVTGNTDDADDLGGLVGVIEGGVIINSYAIGNVRGDDDLGGLVGQAGSNSSISFSYATGNVEAVGPDPGDYEGWGGLVGSLSGSATIEYSHATGNVVADYNAGSLIGIVYFTESELGIIYSTATGAVTLRNTDPEKSYGFGGFIGCQEGSDETCLSADEELTQPLLETPSILKVVNTVGDAWLAFEIVACKNNALPLLSELIHSYANTCPVSTSRERRIREFIQTTSMTEIAKTLGFDLSPTFPNDAPIGFVKNEKELAISKVLGVQKAADRVARTFVKVGEALQISYDFDGKDPIELWVKLPDGKWILAGVIRFDKNGKAILPPIQFKVAGEYVVALNKLSEDSEKAREPLNQIGYLTVIVTNSDSV